MIRTTFHRNRAAPVLMLMLAVVVAFAPVHAQPEACEPPGLFTPTDLTDFVALDGATFTLDGEPYRVRGINYYPSAYPWRRFLTETDAETLDRELALMADVGFNTLRIFLWNEALFVDGEPCADAFHRLDGVMAAAANHNFRLIVTLNDLPPLPDIYTNPPTTETDFIVRRYRDEAAILAWDLRNEGDIDYNGYNILDAGLVAREVVLNWLAETSDQVRGLDDNHLITAGWLRDEQDTEPYVDFVSFHHWQGAESLQSRVARIDLDKPLLLEEIGFTTFDITEAQQAAGLGDVVRFAEGDALLGWMVWTAFDFPLEATCYPSPCISQDNREHHFGIWYTDYTPKPAVGMIRRELRRIDGGVAAVPEQGTGNSAQPTALRRRNRVNILPPKQSSKRIGEQSEGKQMQRRWVWLLVICVAGVAYGGPASAQRGATQRPVLPFDETVSGSIAANGDVTYAVEIPRGQVVVVAWAGDAYVLPAYRATVVTPTTETLVEENPGMGGTGSDAAVSGTLLFANYTLPTGVVEETARRIVEVRLRRPVDSPANYTLTAYAITPVSVTAMLNESAPLAPLNMAVERSESVLQVYEIGTPTEQPFTFQIETPDANGAFLWVASIPEMWQTTNNVSPSAQRVAAGQFVDSASFGDDLGGLGQVLLLYAGDDTFYAVVRADVAYDINFNQLIYGMLDTTTLRQMNVSHQRPIGLYELEAPVGSTVTVAARLVEGQGARVALYERDAGPGGVHNISVGVAGVTDRAFPFENAVEYRVMTSGQVAVVAQVPARFDPGSVLVELSLATGN